MLLQKEQVAETRVSLGMRHTNTFSKRMESESEYDENYQKTHPASSSLPNQETQITHSYTAFSQVHSHNIRIFLFSF